MKSIAIWAYDKNILFLTDLIDAIKGNSYSQMKWEVNKTHKQKHEKNMEIFWKRY